jgi:hypothetical protein
MLTACIHALYPCHIDYALACLSAVAVSAAVIAVLAPPPPLQLPPKITLWLPPAPLTGARGVPRYRLVHGIPSPLLALTPCIRARQATLAPSLRQCGATASDALVGWDVGMNTAYVHVQQLCSE